MVEGAEEHLVASAQPQPVGQDVESLGGAVGEGDLLRAATQQVSGFTTHDLARLLPCSAPHVEPGVRLAEIEIGGAGLVDDARNRADGAVVEVGHVRVKQVAVAERGRRCRPGNRPGKTL